MKNKIIFFLSIFLLIYTVSVLAFNPLDYVTDVYADKNDRYWTIYDISSIPSHGLVSFLQEETKINQLGISRSLMGIKTNITNLFNVVTPKLDISINFLYSDVYNERILKFGQTLTVETKILNTTGASRTVALYTALYNGNDILQYVTAPQPITVSDSKAVQTFFADLVLPISDTDDFYIKTFVWDSETMKPLANSIKLNGMQKDYYSENFDDSSLIQSDRAITGTVNWDDDIDCFKFIAPFNNAVVFEQTKGVHITLYDEDENELPPSTTLIEGDSYYLMVIGSGEYTFKIKQGAPPLLLENINVLELNKIDFHSFSSNFNSGDEEWFAFYADSKMSIETALNHNIGSTYVNVDMELFNLDGSENEEYLTVKTDRGVELNGNLTVGWHLIKAHYSIMENQAELAPYYSPKFDIRIKEGARVLTIDTEDENIAELPQTFVFKPPMEAEYEVITNNGGKTGAMHDSILTDLECTKDDDFENSLYLKQSLLSSRRYYVTVNEADNYTIHFKRYEPIGNVALRFEPTDTPGKMEIYIDNVKENTAQIRFQINYDTQKVNFAGYVPSADLPQNTAIGMTTNNDLIINLPVDDNRQPISLGDQKLCDYYFECFETISSDTDVNISISEAIITRTNDVLYPNLEMNNVYLTQNNLLFSSLQNNNMLEVGKSYVLKDNDWTEVDNQETEADNSGSQFMSLSNSVYTLYEPYPRPPNYVSEFTHARNGTFSDLWLNHPMYLRNVNGYNGSVDMGDLSLLSTHMGMHWNSDSGSYGYAGYPVQIVNSPNVGKNLTFEEKIAAFPENFVKGEMKPVTETNFRNAVNAVGTSDNVGRQVFQVVRPTDTFINNDATVLSKAMKIGTSYTNRQSDEAYKIELKNNHNWRLHYWLIQSDWSIADERGKLVTSGVIDAGMITTLPHSLRGIYFLQVSRETANDISVNNGDYSVKLLKEDISALTTTKPITIIEATDKITIYAYLFITGNTADTVIDLKSGTTYRQATIEGISEKWSGIYKGKAVDVVLVDLNDGKNHITKDDQKSLEVEIRNGHGQCEADLRTITMYQSDIKYGQLPYKSYSTLTFSTVIAHEFGHALGLDHPKEGTQSIMRTSFQSGVTRVDYEYMLKAYKAPPYTYWGEGSWPE